MKYLHPLCQAEGQRPADREIDRPDLVVPRSRSGVKIKAASKGSLKDVIECYWSNALSFIEVKADASHDLKDATVLQCLRYAVSQDLYNCALRIIIGR